MSHEELATIGHALSDPTRTHILFYLLGCCCPVAVTESGETACFDSTAGDICCHITGVDKISSTFSHHLKELKFAGLISMEQHGKYKVCRPRHETLQNLAEFFTTAAGGRASTRTSASTCANGDCGCNANGEAATCCSFNDLGSATPSGGCC